MTTALPCRRLRIGLLAVMFFVCAFDAHAAEPMTGDRIYRKQCASCHGISGEGAKAFPRPLVGDKPLPELAKLIAKTMPEDKPGTLSTDDVVEVSKFVFDTIYSKEARAKNPPPRIELSRLTVRQYRDAVADLIASFRGPPPKATAQGLHGEYFDSRGFDRNKRVIDRTDSEVNLDFGLAGPEGKTSVYEFSVRWEGSLVPPETGDYEIIVHTDHAARLWVNDANKMLVDAWVKSGSDLDHGASIFLLAGRSYTLRVEFSKADQGVKKDKKGPPVPASVSLRWKRPKGAAEVIPSRFLFPVRSPEVFLSSIPFPADDRSLGWERGSAISKAWDAATTDAALEAAAYVANKLSDLAGTRAGDKDRETKLRDFAGKFVERAFRRPLTADQKKVYIDHQFEAAKDPEVAIKRVVLLALKSPRFLYKEGATGVDSFAAAERLAFALWDSLPDKELLDAAVAGKLTSRDEVAKQATRMIADPRAKAKLREFLFTWLKIDPAPDLAKDAKRYPGFGPGIATDLRTSLELFLDDVVWSDASDFRQLFLTDDVYLNNRLAAFYGLGPPPVTIFGINLAGDASFKKVKLDASRRAGVLTHPYLMTGFAYTGTSSPIHRGVFLARGVLGRTLRPPQDAFTPLPEDLHPTLTTRERVALQTKSENCQACHGMINPLGFTLENFDAVGRYRDQENGKAIDATGSYQTRNGDIITLHNARELATFLVGTEEVHAAFADRMFHHLAQQPVQAYGFGALEDLRKSFAANGFNMRRLAVDIAVMAALPLEKKKR
ncbi:MAG TPA: DUF1592 domain-containing protein [Gemmataceae bacterium]|jgi:hypothetical protein|nr:DUF1592 domain-containing protein [Gemmataceae bacterium]